MLDFEEIMVKYIPNLTRYKSPFGAVKQGEEVEFNIEISRETSVAGVFLVLRKDGEDEVRYKMNWVNLYLDCDIFTVSVKPFDLGLYFYYFEIQIPQNVIKVGRNYLNEERLSVKYATEFQLTVYDKNFKTPEWFKGGVMYQIFVDRFNRKGDTPVRSDIYFHENWNDSPLYQPVDGKILNNDFFGGNLYGIIEKLDYLKSLNVSVIYLSPVFKAYSNHKYDTGDYMNVDEMFGGNEALKKLIKACDKKNIRIILDGVFNHTGDDSIYFNKYGKYESLGAFQSVDSEYFKWYNFLNYPESYESWWGIDTLPRVNSENESYRKFITGKSGVIKKWMNEGISGFRLDVVDEISDDFVKDIRKSLKEENKDGILIGEVWEDASSKISYDKRREYFLGFELDSVMNYPLKNGILEFVKNGNSAAVSRAVNLILDNYPKEVVDCLMNITGTHDTIRMLTFLSTENFFSSRDEKASFYLSEEDYCNGIKKVKLASLLQFTLPGVPCIYYGDEIGMQGFEDPFNRATFNRSNENKELLEWYGFLGRLRKNTVFKDGSYKELYSENGVFIFMRFAGKERIIVGVNAGKDEFVFKTDKKYKILNFGQKNGFTIESNGCIVLKEI